MVDSNFSMGELHSSSSSRVAFIVLIGEKDTHPAWNAFEILDRTGRTPLKIALTRIEQAMSWSTSTFIKSMKGMEDCLIFNHLVEQTFILFTNICLLFSVSCRLHFLILTWVLNKAVRHFAELSKYGHSWRNVSSICLIYAKAYLGFVLLAVMLHCHFSQFLLQLHQLSGFSYFRSLNCNAAGHPL